MHPEHAHHEDKGGIESLIDIDGGFSDDDSDAEVCKSDCIAIKQMDMVHQHSGSLARTSTIQAIFEMGSVAPLHA